jgi:hypothetical protein
MEFRRACAPRLLVLATAALFPPLARAQPSDSHVEEIEKRFAVVPGVQFGARSQELSLGFAYADTTTGAQQDGAPFLLSTALGVRVDLVGSGWSPQAVHGLAFVATGVQAGFLWPSVVEASLGYGGGNGRGYGIGGLSYAIGVAGKFEAFVRAQASLGADPTPSWFSNWLFGVRYGFGVGRRSRFKVTYDPLPD